MPVAQLPGARPQGTQHAGKLIELAPSSSAADIRVYDMLQRLRQHVAQRVIRSVNAGESGIVAYITLTGIEKFCA